ncbi:WXG100 family type VII secretion target [Streptomyces sp. NPDC051776]|uniref:WXG100 family type VII secretion target n=1 Tax=Streptomyces sp. NPDC051776 TaxID=3155414 RepID=UPI00343EDF75
MSTQYHARTGNIAEAGELTKACHQHIVDLTEAMMSRTHTTIADWQGPASDSYRNAIARWKVQADRIQTTLREMGLALEQTQVNYDRTELAHVRTMDHMTQLMNSI